jgi:DNA invertase Pin-like site-specific DNA recombinase
VKTRYKPAEPEGISASDIAKLPMDRPVAVYYRQSTEAQVGNISTTIQTVDMIELLKRRGWQEEQIILVDMDKGVSGQTKIDEREGMRYLLDLITSGQIGTVACQDEDRLFRDITQIQVNTFIDICLRYKVFVLTPMMVYDFAHPTMGNFHARQFRFKSEMAAEYISAVIKGKLHPAIRRLRNEGRWAGAGMPPGYMVDMRKKLPDGTDNPQWRRLVPFAPYADVVREYFQLFIACGCSLRTTVRRIHESGPWYPDPATCKPPEGFKIVYRMHRYGKGFCPGRQGLAELLMNAAYLGHWVVKDCVTRWNNHEPIIAIDLFYTAFNTLSDVQLDGTPNKHYTPRTDHAKPSAEADRQVERPLLSGMLMHRPDGQWRQVGTDWVKPLRHYAYYGRVNAAVKDYAWSKTADYVDEAVSRLLLSKLKATFDNTAWQDSLSEFMKSYQGDSRRRQVQIESLQTVVANLLESLEQLTNAELIKVVEKRYEQAKSEIDRLTAEQAAEDTEAQKLSSLHKIRHDILPAIENWPQLTRDEKRVVLQTFIIRIEAEPVAGHGLKLTVQWADKSADGVVLPRQATHGDCWLPEEIEELKRVVRAGADQVQIAAAFPNRPWEQLRQKVAAHVGRGHPFGKQRIRDNETYAQYAARLTCPTPMPPKQRRPWTQAEIEHLLGLYDSGADPMELVQAFPDRDWVAIKKRVRKSRGASATFAETAIWPDETYNQYVWRVQEVGESNTDDATHRWMSCRSSMHAR